LDMSGESNPWSTALEAWMLTMTARRWIINHDSKEVDH
jgi:hypothetical protein